MIFKKLKLLLPFIYLFEGKKLVFSIAAFLGVAFALSSGFALPFFTSKLLPYYFSSSQDIYAVAYQKGEEKHYISVNLNSWQAKLYQKKNARYELLTKESEKKTFWELSLIGEISSNDKFYAQLGDCYWQKSDSEFVALLPNVFWKRSAGDDYAPLPLSKKRFWIFSLWFLVFLGRNFFLFGSSFLSAICFAHIIHRLRSACFEKIQSLPLSFFSKESKGDLLSRISSDVQSLSTYLVQLPISVVKFPLLLLSSVSVICYIFIFQIKSFFFIFQILLFFPILFLIRGFLSRQYKKLRANLALQGKITGIFHENIQGACEVRSFSMEKQQLKLLQLKSKEALKFFLKSSKYKMILPLLMEIVNGFGLLLIFAFFLRTKNDLSTIIPIILASYFAYNSFKKVIVLQTSIVSAIASSERVNYLLNAPLSIQEISTPLNPEILIPRISCKNISFSYLDSNTPALSEINLDFSPGEKIAIVGYSGAGKSTFIQLFFRFLDPSKGEIYFDGKNIRELSLARLRQEIAYVSQKPYLFNQTLFENIRIGKQDATLKEVQKACEFSYCKSFIEELPDAYETILGEGGTRLSIGQCQRLALARAFLKNSSILVLDEATSALDSESEEKIRLALDEFLTKEKLALFIAHRFSSIQMANRILFLEKGKVIADGTHQEIYQDCIAYRNLYDKQKLN